MEEGDALEMKITINLRKEEASAGSLKHHSAMFCSSSRALPSCRYDITAVIGVKAGTSIMTGI